MTAPRDPYVVLGVLPSATPQEIQRAFRRLVRRLHPDTVGGPGDPDELRAIFAAYAALRAGQGGGGADGVDDRDVATAARSGASERRHAPVDEQPPEAGEPARRGLSRRWAERVWPETPDDGQQPPIRVGPVRWYRGT